MKVLVTGANGLLGSHVVRELLSRNFEVRSMVRKGSNLKALEGTNTELFVGRIISRTDVENAVNGCDFVIHVAARTSQSPSDLEAFYYPNIRSTQFFIDVCAKNNIRRFVYVSTANCFGNGSKELPGDEKRPFLSWLKKSGYAHSKWLAQQRVLKSSAQNELNAVVVNPTFMIGENDVKPSSGEIFFYVLDKPVVFCPPGGKNFVDVKAAANGVIEAMLKGRNGECYLLAGENFSYREFFTKVSRTLNQKPVLIVLPGWVLTTAGVVGDFLEKYFKIPVRLTSQNAKMLCTGNYYSAEKAKKELDFKVVPVQQSIERAILWFQNNNYIKR